MKGYLVSYGYKGFIPDTDKNGNLKSSGTYVLFATEKDYADVYALVVKKARA